MSPTATVWQCFFFLFFFYRMDVYGAEEQTISGFGETDNTWSNSMLVLFFFIRFVDSEKNIEFHKT